MPDHSNANTDQAPHAPSDEHGSVHTSRRGFLGVIGVGVGGVALGAVGAYAAVASAGAPAPTGSPAPTRSSGSNGAARTRVVLIGTAAGPQIVNPRRAGVCTAVVYDDRTYLIDLGLGSTLRLAQSKLGGAGAQGSELPLAGVAAIFFTHLHSDHIADWPSVYVTGAANTIGRTEPIHVFGPPDRTELPAVFPPSRPAPEVVNPEAPGLGTVGMTTQLRAAMAADLNDRVRDQGQLDPATVFSVHDIDLDSLPPIGADGVPPRMTEAIEVWTDGDVRVTATLVDHRPTAPALAYRFDTPDGSIVISGDTAVSENLIDLARGCDILIHEAIDPLFIDRLTATLDPEIAPAVKNHLLESHTTIEQVGRDVAEPAGARTLVLSHLNVGTTDAEWSKAAKGYSGTLVIGSDLLEIPLSPA